MTDEPIDPRLFRTVLGYFPTGVTVVTAAPPEGLPTGMAIGSFTSVSLDPPLVAFLPSKDSSTWTSIEAAGAFCVNVMRADQGQICGTFASKEEDKFAVAACDWHPGVTGSPVIDGSLAWIDCVIDAVHEGGDHWIVVGAVQALDVDLDGDPLLFFKGGYGTFS